MKIQNAKLNFVMFDAQDVIATSGPWVGQAMIAQIQTINSYNDLYSDDKICNKNGNQGGFNEVDKWQYWLVYLVDPVDKDLRTAEGKAKSEQPVGSFFVADTAEKIKLWLDTQRGQ